MVARGVNVVRVNVQRIKVKANQTRSLILF